MLFCLQALMCIQRHNVLTQMVLVIIYCRSKRRVLLLKHIRIMKDFMRENSYVETVPWSLVESFDDINEMWQTWHHLFMVVNTHTPQKSN